MLLVDKNNIKIVANKDNILKHVSILIEDDNVENIVEDTDNKDNNKLEYFTE